jgi:transcriptional regulator with XRE-family HTH domain
MEGKVKLDLIEQHVVDFVRKLRADKKLRQEDIAYIIGVKASFIGNVENSSNPAKYNLKHINVFADHFGLSPRDFLPNAALLEKKDKNL